MRTVPCSLERGTVDHAHQSSNYPARAPDAALCLITTLSVIYPGSGYLVVLGKHLRGSFVTRVEHGTVRKVDQNAKVSKREIRTPGGV